MSEDIDGGHWASAFADAESIYLLSHSVGRPPAASSAAVDQRFFEPWRRGAEEPWNDWLGAIEDFRAALARLLNTQSAQLCPQPNLSSGLSRIVSSLRPDKHRATILLSEDDFPSTGFVLQQAQRLGYRLRYLPGGADIANPQLWLDALGEDVGTVFITHVQSNSGRRAPIEQLVPLLREREIVSIVDVAQSAGVVPLDLEGLAADFVIGSCVKWLCGGPGAGYLWVNPDMVERCEPLDVGWFSHAEPFEFDIHSFRYHPSALRFWGGTPSVLPCVTAAVGVGTIEEIGVARAQQHNRELRDALCEALPGHCIVSPREPEACGGTVVLHFGERQGQAVHELLNAGVAFDVRDSGMRLSPHVYNSRQEMAVVSEVLAGVCSD